MIAYALKIYHIPDSEDRLRCRSQCKAYTPLERISKLNLSSNSSSARWHGDIFHSRPFSGAVWLTGFHQTCNIGAGTVIIIIATATAISPHPSQPDALMASCHPQITPQHKTTLSPYKNHLIHNALHITIVFCCHGDT